MYGMATCCKIRKCFDGGTLAFNVLEQCLSFQWSAFAVATDHKELQAGGHLVRLLYFGARQKQTARSGSHNNEHASSNSRRGLRGDTSQFNFNFKEKLMILQDVFVRASVIVHLESGPLGAYLSDLAAALNQQRYTVHTIQKSLHAADAFGRWLIKKEVPLEAVAEHVVQQYIAGLGRRTTKSAIVESLEEQGSLNDRADPEQDDSN